MDPKRERQMREAKRRQRQREAEAGLGVYQVRLPQPLLKRFKVGMRQPEFVAALTAFLEQEVLHVIEYGGLASICWNLREEYLTRREAFALYERNWRYLDVDSMTEDETRLLDELREEFGRGVINA